jgi:Tfp pilus assembly protein PilF
MRRAFAASTVLILVSLAAAGCRSSSDTSRPETQRQFGVRMAKMNLWREAMFRFRRAVEIEPQDAMTHNNLAVAYEANGDFDNAAKAYREALRLDRTNQYIAKNYSRFVEFTSRDKKRPNRTTATTTTTAAAAVTTTAPAMTPAAPPVTDTAPVAPAPASVPPPDPVAPPATTTTTNPPSGGAA